MTDKGEIPRPRSVPILGNALVAVHPATAFFDLQNLADELGPIYALDMPGYRDAVVLSEHLLTGEVADDARFDKSPAARIRSMVGDGLFTAFTDSPEWHRGHRIIAPAFTREAIARCTRAWSTRSSSWRSGWCGSSRVRTWTCQR